jgi:hypothetical protein
VHVLRDLRRRTLGATAGAVIAPLAILAAAVALGVGGGGLGGLGSIGQAITGPEPPDVTPVVARERAPADEAGRLLTRVSRRERRAAAPRGAARGRSTSPVAAPSAPAPARNGGAGDRRPDDPTTTPVRAPAGGAPAPAAPPAPIATPVPARTPSVVRQVGDGVKQVTDRVPVAGQPVGQVVDQLVETVDGLPNPLDP